MLALSTDTVLDHHGKEESPMETVYATQNLRTPRGLVTRGQAGVVEGKIVQFGKTLYDVKWTNGVHDYVVADEIEAGRTK